MPSVTGGLYHVFFFFFLRKDHVTETDIRRHTQAAIGGFHHFLIIFQKRKLR